MFRIYHPSGNKILINFIGKRINIITNNLKKRIKKNTETPERFKRKLLTQEEMAIIQSGGAYNNFYY